VKEPETIKNIQDIFLSWHPPNPKPTIITFSKEISALIKTLPQKYPSSYPSLKHGFNNYSEPSKAYPTTLAEALIWKLGKWKTFMKFTAHYKKALNEVPNTGVVFYAFARHLAEEKEPIFDQHALRAAWTVCPHNQSESEAIKRSLFYCKGKKKGQWKPNGTGKDYSQCVKIYKNYILRFIPENYTRENLMLLDMFFMPLGQLIKEQAKNLDQYKILSGREII
jgi:hypothetical protein